MTRKLAQRIHTAVRFALQLAFFVFLPALWSTAFMGARYIAEQIAGREALDLNPFVLTMLILFAFTVVFGRFFCGYACAFGSLGDWLFAGSAFVQKKLRHKVFKLPAGIIGKLQYPKFAVLVAILAACLTGTYHYVSGADPWGLFAQLRAGNFTLDGYLYALPVLVLIVIGMLLVERFFCQFLCPLGALFALLPMLPQTLLARNKENCIKGCSACSKTCPAAISLGEPRSKVGECFQCGKCATACPKGNIATAITKHKSIELTAIIIKAATLFAICFLLI